MSSVKANGNTKKRPRRKVLVFPPVVGADDSQCRKDFAIDEDDYHVIGEILAISEVRDDEIQKHAREMVEIREDDAERRVDRLRIPNYPLLLSLPASIERLTGLTQLSFDKNDVIASIPSSIGHLKNLTHLSLSFSEIESLPPSIGRLKNLKQLNLSGMEYLFRLPEEIGDLTNLIELILIDSRIESLPKSIGNLKNLKLLDLSCESVESEYDFRNLWELPDEIGNLTSLEKLDLGKSKIVALPPSIGRLPNLEELDLRWTSHLINLPQEIGDLKELRTLDLYGSSLESLPPSIGELRSLENLNLELSKVSLLPSSIGRLQNLKRLDIQKSALLELPNEVWSLKCLQELTTLNLSRSTLSELSTGIGNLLGLKSLWLSQTKRLLELPAEIGNLTNLKELRLNFSSIRAIPATIGNLKNLEYLSLCSTKNLIRLPEEIGKLSGLIELDLVASEITSLPDSIGRLSNLKSIGLTKSRVLAIQECPGSFQLTLAQRLRSLVFIGSDKFGTALYKEKVSKRIGWRGSRAYFSYADVHETVSKLVPMIRTFDPSVIIAIGGGSLPALMLRKEFKIPMLTVSLEMHEDETGKDRSTSLERLQWFDESKILNRKILIVDVVDNTRATLQRYLDEITRTGQPSETAVAVLHNKRKRKQGKLPVGTVYLAGNHVAGHWTCCYPWDAASYGEHETMVGKCTYDW